MVKQWRLSQSLVRSDVAVFGIIFALYYVMARVSLVLLADADWVGMIWPASGIAAGAVLVLEPRMRVPIAAAVAVGTVAAGLSTDRIASLNFAFAVCNSAECLLFGELMRALDRSRGQLEQFSSVLAFFVSAAAAPAIAAVPAALSVTLLANSASDWTQVWLTWWRSDGIGIVVLAPMILTFPSLLRNRPGRWVMIESGIALVLTVTMAIFAFSRSFSGSAPVPAPASFIFPTFVWLAARTPPFISALAVCLVSLVVVALALMGESGEAALPLGLRLVSAQSSIVTGSAALLTMASLFARMNNVANALKSSEQSLRLALSAASMYAFEYDLERKVVMRSGRLARHLGLPETGDFEQIGSVVHPDDRIDFDELFGLISPEHPELRRALRMRTPEGEKLVIEYMSEGVFGSDGKLRYWRGICIDVTERERSREAFEAQSQRLSGALAAGRVLAFDYDVEKQAVTRSDNAADIFGVTREEALSTANIFSKRVHPDDRKALYSYGTSEALDQGSRRQTFRFIRGDGRLVWLELTSTGIVDASGKLRVIRGLARDVTEETRLAQRQTTLIRELDHRVKNALARMKVVVEVSRSQHQTLDDYVKVIEGRIISMARTQERLSSSKWTGVGLETLVEDELAAYRTDDNCTISGPAHLLAPDSAQAFAFTLHELATNAAKHGALSRPGGKVDVRWRVASNAADRTLELSWRETVPGGIVPPVRESYGLDTIRRLLVHEQDAEVEVDFAPSGLIVSIAMPLPPILAEGTTGEPAYVNPEAPA